MNEHEIIQKLLEPFARSRDQRNAPFGCDAELVEIGGRLWGLTIDEFSPEEDLFSAEDPECLGANLATATLSDLLAAGVEPRFFLHALSLPRAADTAFIEGVGRGIARVLQEVGCTLCGGDIGTADPWRFCGFAMGPVTAEHPITHRIPDSPQDLWVSGELGDANLAALQSLPAPRLELRLNEAALVRERATACIDTSGGLLDAVWILHEQNPTLRLQIDLDQIPFATGLAQFAQESGVSAEAALLGGAGEYELLFTTPADLTERARARIVRAGAKCIGTVWPDPAPGIHFYRDSEYVGEMRQPPPCPRSASNVAAHAQQVLRLATELFGR